MPGRMLTTILLSCALVAACQTGSARRADDAPGAVTAPANTQPAATERVITDPATNRPATSDAETSPVSAGTLTPAGTVAPAGAAAPPALHDIQGAGHVSPLVDYVVAGIHGIVTARIEGGFWMQASAAEWDDDPATSEGIYVLSDDALISGAGSGGLAAGDEVFVSGTIREIRPGNSSNNLSTTTLDASDITVVAHGRPPPPAIPLGEAGRIPPDGVIDDDALSVFEPRHDGIDFFESLEGMLVRVDGARCVGPRSKHGEIPVVCDDGAHASTLGPRGTLAVSPGDFNPERIVLDDGFAEESSSFTGLPAVKVGDRLDDRLVGVMDYSFGAYKVQVLDRTSAKDGDLRRERAATSPPEHLRVGTFNVENLSAESEASRFEAIAAQIVDGLGSPDLLGVQEIQDDDGPACTGTVAADLTWTRLVGQIEAAGGPTYSWTDIAPQDKQDGGQPCGNIRVGFLWRTDRGVDLVARPGGTATRGTVVAFDGASPALSYSPGRVEPGSPAWTGSRKALAAEFTYRGRTLFAIVNHLRSKGGDTPLFGAVQPPVQHSGVKRLAQAQVVNAFVKQILAFDEQALVIVMGDMNDFQFSVPVTALAQDALHNLTDLLDPAERYTYLFGGNAQVLDHVLVSAALFGNSIQYDVVHVNAEFPDPASDHDPAVASLSVPPAP